MARVRLRVVLDDPDRSRTTGEVVAGHVEVEADEAANCSALKARVLWRTVGDANEATGSGPPEVLGTGEWRPGDRLSFPFSLTVPPGPPTYEGRHFEVVWLVRADADLSWAFDGKSEEPFPVVPEVMGDPVLEKQEEAGGLAVGCSITSLLAFGTCVAAILLARRGAGFGWWAGAIGGGILSLFVLLWASGYRRMGRVTLEAGPSPAARGGELACRIVLRPRKDLAPKSVVAVLKAKEKSVKGSGKSKTSRDVEIWKGTADLQGPETIPGGEEGVYAGLIEIPADAPPTVEAEPNGVAWKLEVEVKHDGWGIDPDYEVAVKVV